MKLALVPCAAALLAMSQAAVAAEPLCEGLDTYAAAQWREPTDPAPRYWVEFHWGIAADSADRWSWSCRDSGDTASGEFCDRLVEDTSRGSHAYLPFALLRCMGDEVPEQADAERQFIQGKFRRRAQDGAWIVLEVVSSGLQPGERAVRISFDAEDRRLDPEDLPAIRPYAPEPEAPGTLK
jgi:hypothetical protein